MLSRLLHRGKELDERRPVLRPGVLLQRLAQRHVLQPSRRTEAGGIGRHEGKRACGIVLVFRQMKAHPPDLMPLRRPRLQERFQSTRCGDRLVHPTVQGLPDVLHHHVGKIFPALHWRCCQDKAGEIGRRRRFDLKSLRGLGNVAQIRHIPFRQCLPVAQCWCVIRNDLVRRQRKESFPPIGLKCFP